MPPTSRHKHPRCIGQPGKGVDTGRNGHHILCDDHHSVDVHKPQGATPICHQYVVRRTGIPFQRDETVIFIVLCSLGESWVSRLSAVCGIGTWSDVVLCIGRGKRLLWLLQWYWLCMFVIVRMILLCKCYLPYVSSLKSRYLYWNM